MASRSFRVSGVLAALVVMTVGGCSGGDESAGRAAVSGAVTLDGAPLAQGSIQFLPNSPDGSVGGGVIQDGKYAVPRQNGLKPGSYTVVINSSLAGPSSASADPTAPVAASATAAKELVPEKYNSKSRVNVEITAEGPNNHDFELKK